MKMRLGTLFQILGWILFAATVPFIYLMFRIAVHGDYGHAFWTYARAVIVLGVIAFICFFFSLSFANMLCLLSTTCAGIWQILALLFFGGPVAYWLYCAFQRFLFTRNLHIFASDIPFGPFTPNAWLTPWIFLFFVLDMVFYYIQMFWRRSWFEAASATVIYTLTFVALYGLVTATRAFLRFIALILMFAFGIYLMAAHLRAFGHGQERRGGKRR